MEVYTFQLPSIAISLLCVLGPRLSAPYQWIPKTVTQDLLYDGSKVHLPDAKIWKYSEQGRRLLLEVTNNVQLYITSEPVSMAKGYVLHSDEESYQILASNVLNTLHKEVSKPSALFFAVEQKKRGALFRLVTCNESGYMLEYACPLAVFDIGDTSERVDYSFALALYARKLPSGSKFWITFEPIVGFKPLQRYHERRPRVGLYHLLISVVVYLLYLVYNITWFILSDDIRSPWYIDLTMLFFCIIISFGRCIVFGCCGIPVSIPILSAIMFIYEYVLFWQSYDDNTVIDRIKRYIISTTRNAWILLGRLRDLFRRQLDLRDTGIVLGNEIEV